MKYIQDTDVWKKAGAKAAKNLKEECRKATEKVIFECFGVKKK